MSTQFTSHPEIVYPRIAVPVEYENRNVWLFRALDDADNRRAKSGLIYEDDVNSQYSYSNNVPNSKRVAKGDLVLVRDNHVLFGAAVIQEITEQETTREQLRCPICNSAKLYWRPSKNDWRCDGTCLRLNGLSADARSTTEPIRNTVANTSYTAYYGDTWSELSGAMVAGEFSTLSDKWNPQNSIVQLNPVKVLAFFDRLKFSIREQIDVKTDGLLASGGFTERTVRTRRGQTQFRAHLFGRFGSTCAFTGPCYLAALDAAHLYSYAQVGEHRAGGGLLMRRDLHSLFDRGLLGIDNHQRITIHEDLTTTQYRPLLGERLKVDIGEQEKALLARHSEEFKLNLMV
ncbi:HNH endonuclease signature motif containing protein [Rothia terrae]|uniref:HNH endonuclease n=1 Tax=Rothia terrae TaxID=396015 RepID=A0A7H2BDV9_9MICC|nr:HNH endonuclease signature motif containing protein [Rothia terrae]QNV37855.1 HNH endonuclease [Rothia terrae]